MQTLGQLSRSQTRALFSAKLWVRTQPPRSRRAFSSSERASCRPLLTEARSAGELKLQKLQGRHSASLGSPLQASPSWAKIQNKNKRGANSAEALSHHSIPPVALHLTSLPCLRFGNELSPWLWVCPAKCNKVQEAAPTKKQKKALSSGLLSSRLRRAVQTLDRSSQCSVLALGTLLGLEVQKHCVSGLAFLVRHNNSHNSTTRSSARAKSRAFGDLCILGLGFLDLRLLNESPISPASAEPRWSCLLLFLCITGSLPLTSSKPPRIPLEKLALQLVTHTTKNL